MVFNLKECSLDGKLPKIVFAAYVLYASIGIISCNIEPKLQNYNDLSTPILINSAENTHDLSSIDDRNLNIHKNNDNNRNDPSSLPAQNLGFIHAFVASITVILVSELGDKTFFIAAIMAMRHSRLNIFSGAMSALALMTILSAIFGMAATIIPRVYTHYISTALFAIFGLKLLKEGYYMSGSEVQEEIEEVQSDIKKREDELEKEVSTSLKDDPESGVIRKTKKRNAAYMHSRIFLQAFTMTFLAEWGDRSQLTTIILAAREDVIGVIVGGVLGHSFCTGLAVIGGRMIAQKISVRTVTLVGGVVFLIFALSSIFMDPDPPAPTEP